MNLHRTGKEAQWESVKPNKRNVFQRIAARTNGILTPGNLASAVGGALVLSGLKDLGNDKHGRGLTKIGIGRMFDLVDGSVAAATGTMSPLGEKVDIGVDKVLVFASMYSMYKKGYIPGYAAGIILGQNVANAGVSYIGNERGVEMHPSKEGKLNMAAQWATIGMFGLAAAAKKREHETAGMVFERTAQAGLGVVTGLGSKAIIGYAQEAFGPVTEEAGQFTDHIDQMFRAIESGASAVKQAAEPVLQPA